MPSMRRSSSSKMTPAFFNKTTRTAGGTASPPNTSHTPLTPASGDVQRVVELNLPVRILSDYPVSAPDFTAAAYPVRTIRSDPNDFEAEFQAHDVQLSDDFAFNYRIEVPESTLSIIAYRAPEQITAYDLRDPSLAAQNPDGYFQATAIFNQSRRQIGQTRDAND